jgi:hypothetical protein
LSACIIRLSAFFSALKISGNASEKSSSYALSTASRAAKASFSSTKSTEPSI